MSRRIVGLLSVLLLSARCSTRPPTLTSSQLADMTRAEAMVHEGCYRCLRDAYEIYAGLADRPSPVAMRRAFDVTLLMAVREKEVGLPADQSLTRARALLARLARSSAAARAQSDGDPATLLKAGEAVVGDLSGLDSDERQRRSDRLDMEQIAAADAIGQLQQILLKSATTSETAAYLALAIDCEQPSNRRGIDQAALRAQAGSSPLMRYRLAICSDGQPTPLTQLRQGNSRWTDTFFFEGRFEMGSPSRAPEPVRAAALLTSASETFPDSIAIHMMLARAQEMNGDFAASLASFDQILARKPAHVDARLGRVRTLTYLGRADEAIEAATELIDVATWHVGDAYYWRAWNTYQTHRLEPAWADIQHAMTLRANTAVYALAGSIAYARKELDLAVGHFDRAFEMDSSNCPAVSSAGLVHMDQAAWQLAAESFSKATNCFTLAASTAGKELTSLEQSPIEPELKARRMSSARKRIESGEELAGQSALNAAQSFVQSGQTRPALDYIELAEGHPGTREQALALRARIGNVR
jgi:tetratricopeptide (TPR) repeat protein